MRSGKRYLIQNSILLCLLFGLHFQLAANTENLCNPVVHVGVQQASLSEALVYLAEKNSFKLSFPKNLDREISLNERLPLDKMVKYLTRDLNTVLNHDDSTTCTGKKLKELIIIPSGENTDFIIVNFVQQKPVLYITIEDMDAYARDVKAGKYKANFRQMTPEQKVEFKHSKRKLQKNPHRR